MKLFILRHGDAGAYTRPDATRALTEKGIRDARAIGRKLKAESVRLDAIISSPYLRTRQTMDNFLHAYGSEVKGICHEALAPGSSVQEVLDLLADIDCDGHLLLVSHMPLVSSLVASLVTGSESAAHQYPMEPASLAELDVEFFSSGFGTLKRLISPPYDS